MDTDYKYHPKDTYFLMWHVDFWARYEFLWARRPFMILLYFIVVLYSFLNAKTARP